MTLRTPRSVLCAKALVALAPLALIANFAQVQPGWMLSHQKISDTQGGFTGTLDNNDRFGIAAASLGDLDAKPHCLIEAEWNPVGFGTFHFDSGAYLRSRS